MNGRDVRLIQRFARRPLTDAVSGWRMRGEAFEVTTGDGAILRGEVAGHGPPLVLTHHWMGDRSTWEPVAARLMATHRVVMYDQRGHGHSTPGSSPASIERLGADLETVIGALGLGSPAVAGHSLGGMGLLALAAADPGAVGALVLVSTSACAAPSLRLRAPTIRVGHLLASRAGDRLMAGAAGRIALRGAFGARPPQPAVDRSLAAILATPPRVRGDQLMEVATFDIRDRLASITAPAAIVVGRRDTLTPVRHARVLRDGIVDASLTVLPGAGHMLPLERPDAIADLIAATVRRSQPTSERARS